MTLPAMALCLLAQDLPPEEALKTFRVAEGFQIELVAAEPDVVDPVAMAFDERGHLYVAEMRDYPLGPPAGRIRRLEDRDGDGRMDRSETLAEGLPFPTSVLPWRGGVLVTCAYEILHLKDGVRRTLFAGFGRQNSQHVLNGLQHGLDGWIYGSNGLSGGRIGDVTLRQMDFRMRPDTGDFEPVTGNGQFGNAFDEWGRRFLVRHDNHLVHAVLPYAALKRRPHVPVSAVEDSISDHGAIPKLFPISRPDAAFTTDTDSSCGIAVWLGRAYVCEPVLNLVHEDELLPKGASFRARRARPDAEFLASSDPWFRPVNLALGPDGALYVADMQRAVIEHPDYIPKDAQKKLDFDAGRGKGRIYRIRPRGPRSAVTLAEATTEGLAAALEHPNPWVRTTAQRLLLERRDPAVVPLLKAARAPLARLHALWTLEALGALDQETATAALRDPEPGLREHAIQLAKGPLPADLADDPDPRVRFQAAFRLDDPEALARIAARDGDDPWTRAAVALSASSSPAAFLDRLDVSRPGSLDLVRMLAEAVKSRADAKETSDWLDAATRVDRPVAFQRAALTAVGIGFRGPLPPRVGEWEARARRALSEGPIPERIESLALVALLAPPGAAKDVEALLSPREPPDVQAAAVRALASWPGDPAGGRLLDGWSGRTGAIRREILSAVLARPERIRGLLDRIEKGEIRAVDLEPHRRAELLRHPDGALRERSRKLLQAVASTDRDEAVREVAGKLAGLKGDAARGQKVFASSCAACHRLGGQGTQVGPDLEAALRRDRQALLVDLLDPNRAMDPAYQVYVVRTVSGESFNGIIAADTPASVTLRRAAGEESTLLRKDIAELRAWPASLMPDGLESALTGQDFADLLEFLRAR
ncbi:MAG TPA: PVC-type heme-binding CxxCH protein [Planctomycetota bacterium]|nr:PVC-type heme-binding CxxCH protein [Planctomycetota bacterium]